MTVRSTIEEAPLSPQTVVLPGRGEDAFVTIGDIVAATLTVTCVHCLARLTLLFVLSQWF